MIRRKRRAEKGEKKIRREKVCRFCRDKIKEIPFDDVKLFKNCLTERGKIIPRRISGNCAKHQRKLSRSVKQARILSLLPFVEK